MEWYKIKLSKDELLEIKDKEEEITKIQLLKRLQSIKLKNKNWKNKEIASFLWVNINTITLWIKSYKINWLKWLLSWKYFWKESKLTDEQIKELKAKNNETPFETAKEAKNYIEKHFQLIYNVNWVQRMLKKNFDFHTRKHD